ncbi:MAG: extracellular solute-binding protein [Lachnospiraceae bacterium]|nr:extracellular solute-binding protein [Lachnospiraceae bacterium]
MEKIKYKKIIQIIAIVLCMVFLINNARGVLAEESKEAELNIAVFSTYSGFETIADMFMDTHPGVKVSIKNYAEMYFEDDEYEDLAELYEKFSEDIGDGCDVINLAGSDYVTAIDDGLLEDLNAFMEKDKDFKKDDYFDSTFKIYERNGGVYALPKAAEPVYLKINRNLLKANNLIVDGNEVTFSDLEDLYKEVINNNSENIDYHPGGALELRMLDETYYRINGLDYDSDYSDFVSFMESIDGFSAGGVSDMTFNYMDSNLFSRRLEIDLTKDLDELMNESESTTAACSYVGTHGERYAECYAALGISSGSNNKELAWEFIKFAMGETDFIIGDEYMISMNKNKAERQYANLKDETKNRLFEDLNSADTTWVLNKEYLLSE